MIEKYTLDMLGANSVSLLYQKFTEQGEQVGQNHRKSYSNSEQGRVKAEDEIPEPYKSAVFAVWGSEPTVFPEEE